MGEKIHMDVVSDFTDGTHLTIATAPESGLDRPEWSNFVRMDIDLTADPVLVALMHELSELPASPSERRPGGRMEGAKIVMPMRLQTDAGVLDLFSTTTVFGTPVDITLSELAIESFFPANSATADALRALCPQT